MNKYTVVTTELACECIIKYWFIIFISFIYSF